MQRRYLVQRLHPRLRIGVVPSVAHGDRLIPVHCRQGQWDGACGAHCAAMALALLGDIHDVAVVSERRHGVAARLWRAAQTSYFDGVNATQLAAMLESLEIHRTVAIHEGRHARCLAFALQQLAAGRLVIASWHSLHGYHHHWCLIIGSEGEQIGQTYLPTTLLALDPGVDEPLLCAYNARLEYTVHPTPRSSTYVRYLTLDGNMLTVRLTSALSIGDKVPVQP